MSAIPAAGEIHVKDAPKITPLEFAMQIMENIQQQIKTIDVEFLSATAENSEVAVVTTGYYWYKTMNNYKTIFNLWIIIYLGEKVVGKHSWSSWKNSGDTEKPRISINRLKHCNFC